MPWRARLPLILFALLTLWVTTLLLTLDATPVDAQSGEGVTPAFPARIVHKDVCPGGDVERSAWLVESTSGRRARLTLMVSRATQWPSGDCASAIEGETILVAASSPAPDATLLPGTSAAVAAHVIRRYPTPTPLAINRIDIRGIFRESTGAVTDGSQMWTFDTTVAGLVTVTVTTGEGGTHVEPAGVIPTAGMLARVIAESREGGPFIASRIQFSQEQLSFTGLITDFPNSHPPDYRGPWTVGGRTFVVDTTGIVFGEPKLYRRATVKAEQQGNGVLKAVQVTIDDAATAAEAFTLQGRLMSLSTRQGTVGCLPFSVAPGASIGDGLLNELVEVGGYRTLGVNGVYTATRIMRLTGKPLASDLAVSSYVDSRSEANGIVQLRLGGFQVNGPARLARLDEAMPGTVVRIEGMCQSAGIAAVEATRVEILAKPFIRFKGRIVTIETGLAAQPPQILVIQLEDGGDRIRVRPPVPWNQRYDPVEGYCADGFGFLLSDGTVEAKSLKVDRCSTPPPAPIPAPLVGAGRDQHPPAR